MCDVLKEKVGRKVFDASLQLEKETAKEWRIFGSEMCKNDGRNTFSIMMGYKKQWRTYSYILSFISAYVGEKNLS
jgi:hypothetical protein